MDIGQRLSALMKERKLTQKMMSERTGISQGSISNFVRNEFSPSLEMLQKLCSGLGVTVTEFLEPLVINLPEGDWAMKRDGTVVPASTLKKNPLASRIAADLYSLTDEQLVAVDSVIKAIKAASNK